MTPVIVLSLLPLIPHPDVVILNSDPGTRPATVFPKDHGENCAGLRQSVLDHPLQSCCMQLEPQEIDNGFARLDLSLTRKDP